MLGGSVATAASTTRPGLARERILGLALLLPSLVVFGTFLFWPLARTFKLIDAELKAVHSEEWERTFSLFRLLI